MVYIVIPAYNEARNIAAVIYGLKNAGFSTIVVVDDGSTDATADSARRAGAVVLTHGVNRGQGAALETGNEYARRMGAEYVVHFDGDGQFSPSDIAPALSFMREHALDVVLGSRFLDKRSTMPWLKRFVILPIARYINYIFTGLRLSDAHNGFRILNRRALHELRISHDGMAHNTEIVAEIARLGLTYREFPVAVTYTRFGQGIRGGLKTIRDVVAAPWIK